MSAPRSSPLVSAAELEALIARWGDTGMRSVDRFFPLRMWLLVLIVLGHAIVMMAAPHSLAEMIVTDGNVQQMTRFIYIRGWGQAVAVLVGLYAYLRNWYPGLVFGAFGLVTVAFLPVDLVMIYPRFLADPSPLFTLHFASRIIGIACLTLNMLNCLRLPTGLQRLNPLLFLKSGPSSS